MKIRQRIHGGDSRNPLMPIVPSNIPNVAVKKSPRKKVSPKGKRKLDFQKKGEDGLLKGKKFYLDIQGAVRMRQLQEKILEHNGTVEEFLSKELDFVLTDKKADDYKQLVTRSTPSPFSGPSPLQQLSSNKCSNQAGNSPFSTDSPQNVDVKRIEPSQTTRGTKFLKRAAVTQKLGTSDILTNARTWGVKVVKADSFLDWILRKRSLSVTETKKRAVLSTTRKLSSGSLTVRRLKTPFLKVEDLTRKYKPLVIELKSWPFISFETRFNQCPFDSVKAEPTQKGDNAGKEINDQSQKNSNRSENSSPESKKEKTDANKSAGYCECCNVRYNDFNMHIRGDQHRNFASDSTNYSTLDAIIAKGYSLEAFLQQISEKSKTTQRNVNLTPVDSVERKLEKTSSTETSASLAKKDDVEWKEIIDSKDSLDKVDSEAKPFATCDDNDSQHTQVESGKSDNLSMPITATNNHATTNGMENVNNEKDCYTFGSGVNVEIEDQSKEKACLGDTYEKPVLQRVENNDGSGSEAVINVSSNHTDSDVLNVSDEIPLETCGKRGNIEPSTSGRLKIESDNDVQGSCSVKQIVKADLDILLKDTPIPKKNILRTQSTYSHPVKQSSECNSGSGNTPDNACDNRLVPECGKAKTRKTRRSRRDEAGLTVIDDTSSKDSMPPLKRTRRMTRKADQADSSEELKKDVKTKKIVEVTKRDTEPPNIKNVFDRDVRVKLTPIPTIVDKHVGSDAENTDKKRNKHLQQQADECFNNEPWYCNSKESKTYAELDSGDEDCVFSPVTLDKGANSESVVDQGKHSSTKENSGNIGYFPVSNTEKGKGSLQTLQNPISGNCSLDTGMYQSNIGFVGLCQGDHHAREHIVTNPCYGLRGIELPVAGASDIEKGTTGDELEIVLDSEECSETDINALINSKISCILQQHTIENRVPDLISNSAKVCAIESTASIPFEMNETPCETLFTHNIVDPEKTPMYVAGLSESETPSAGKECLENDVRRLFAGKDIELTGSLFDLVSATDHSTPRKSRRSKYKKPKFTDGLWCTEKGENQPSLGTRVNDLAIGSCEFSSETEGSGQDETVVELNSIITTLCNSPIRECLNQCARSPQPITIGNSQSSDSFMKTQADNAITVPADPSINISTKQNRKRSAIDEECFEAKKESKKSKNFTYQEMEDVSVDESVVESDSSKLSDFSVGLTERIKTRKRRASVKALNDSTNSPKRIRPASSKRTSPRKRLEEGRRRVSMLENDYTNIPPFAQRPFTTITSSEPVQNQKSEKTKFSVPGRDIDKDHARPTTESSPSIFSTYTPPGFQSRMISPNSTLKLTRSKEKALELIKSVSSIAENQSLPLESRKMPTLYRVDKSLEQFTQQTPSRYIRTKENFHDYPTLKPLHKSPLLDYSKPIDDVPPLRPLRCRSYKEEDEEEVFSPTKRYRTVDENSRQICKDAVNQRRTRRPFKSLLFSPTSAFLGTSKIASKEISLRSKAVSAKRASPRKNRAGHPFDFVE